jgi:hypothetical protein
MMPYNVTASITNRVICKITWLLAGLYALLLLSGCQTLGNTASQANSVPSAEVAVQPEVDNARIIEDLGIEVVAIRTTAAGSMLDFRFKVLDKEKAMPFFLKELQPHLIDKRTGAVLEVPVPAKGGPMRPTSRDPREGITYFMLFANPGSFIKAGNQVAIVIGDIRVDNLVVE